jgi:hypothetical protein
MGFYSVSASIGKIIKSFDDLSVRRLIRAGQRLRFYH